MIPKIGNLVSNLSQLVHVKTRIPPKRRIIKQWAAVYIQQNPTRSVSTIVCITITNAKELFSREKRSEDGDSRAAFSPPQTQKAAAASTQRSWRTDPSHGVSGAAWRRQKTRQCRIYDPPSKTPDQRSRLHERLSRVESRQRETND